MDSGRTVVRWSTHSNSPGWYEDGSGCHLWTGTHDADGYGRARDPDKKGVRRVYAIRYEREVGPIPEGMQLDHFACDNKGCCNPQHVRPVTRRENTLRCDNSVAAKNAARTHCTHGHALTPDNLVPYYTARGRRHCKTCHKAAARATYLRRKARRA